ncbi:MAG: META domain-containing protein [Bacteroidales bacterium]
MKVIKLGILTLITVITASCGYSLLKGGEGNKKVENKRWQLIELLGKEVKGQPDTHYLIFHSKDKRVEARAGCNILLLPYTIKKQFALQISKEGVSTMMACPDNLEEELKGVLAEADNLTTDGQYLSINKGRMAPLARFKLIK